MSDANPSPPRIPRAGERYRHANGRIVTVEHYTETPYGEPGVQFHDPGMNWSVCVPLWKWNSCILRNGQPVPRFTLVPENG